MNPKKDKEALQQLRQDRKPHIEKARQSIQEQVKIIKAVKTQIETAAKTVPAIAQALGMETAVVLVFISALRKYGEVVEGPKDGAYFTYQLSQ